MNVDPLSPSSSDPGLDEQIFIAELRVVRSDALIRRELNQLDRCVRRAAQRGVVAATGGAFLTGFIVTLLMARSNRPHPVRVEVRPERKGAPAALAWVQLLPLVWTWMPPRWRARMPAQAEMLLTGGLASLLRILGRNRR